MTTIRFIAPACLLVLALQTASGQAGSAATSPLPDTAVARLGKAFVSENQRVGISVGIIKNGRTYFYNFGTTDKDQNRAPTRNTGYEIGSISKTFTALLLAQAVLEKKVNLADDVRKYLPGTYPNLAYRGNPVKLVHLVNTTSALPDNLPGQAAVVGQANPDSIPFLIARYLGARTRQDFLADLRTITPDTLPGLVPRHSNAAAQLLGYILESVYQMPYGELVKKYIEKPLGMDTAATPGAMAKGYNGQGQAMPYLDMASAAPAGGLRYSTADMVKYLAHQLDEKKEVIRLTHQPTWGEVNEKAIGFNWIITKTIDGKRQLRHSGGTLGFAAYCEFYPELDYGIVLLANQSDGTAQGRLATAAAAIRAAIYGTPPALKALRAELGRRGYDEAIDVVNQVKRRHPELHLTEDYVNEWGYELLGSGKTKEALGLFKLNVHLFPGQSNTYDSLAEAYEKVGNRGLAIQNYRRSLELNPGNTHAAAALQRLAAGSRN